MRGAWWSEGHRARGARERVGCIGSTCTVSGTVCVCVCACVCRPEYTGRPYICSHVYMCTHCTLWHHMVTAALWPEITQELFCRTFEHRDRLGSVMPVILYSGGHMHC